MYNIEEYDNEKTKVLKYALYKKRTIREIKTKFRSVINEEMLEDILLELEEVQNNRLHTPSTERCMQSLGQRYSW